MRWVGKAFLVTAFLLALPGGSGAAEDAGTLPEIGRQLVSHRAIYNVSLVKRDTRGYRSGVKGGLSLEFHNSCEGYALNQRFLIETATEDGDVVSDMKLGSFESKDGRQLKFRLNEQNGDGEADEIVGEAKLGSTGGKVIFTQPADTDIDLPPGAIFPTEHTMRLIQAGRRGETFLRADVYDGSTAEDYAEIGGFIGRTQAPEKGEEPVLAPLKGQRSWRVRLGYFPTSKTSDTPEYEIAFRLFENGVSDDIIFDYGDYAIGAKLQKLEILPQDRC